MQQDNDPKHTNKSTKVCGEKNKMCFPHLNPMQIRAVTVAVTTMSPAVVCSLHGCCIATGGSARDVTHSITSLIQSFVNKCNIVTVANCFI